MSAKKISICGLPGSGKTTFLAALWYLVTSDQGKDLALTFGKLTAGDNKHLNSISRRWVQAESQDRTKVSAKEVVCMNLITNENSSVLISFPDLSGETYTRMWEGRTCEQDVADILEQSTGLLLFINANGINFPRWIIEDSVLKEQLELDSSEASIVIPWEPKLAPTQVQLVDILQSLRGDSLNFGATKLAVMLSAWDMVENQRLTPEKFLSIQLPLLYQYLDSKSDSWDWRVFGVSAQGGDYGKDVESIRACASPIKRIRLIGAGEEVHDITVPLAWLVE